MSMVGTFDGFTAARLGLYAAQHGLRVTGNNVANINTLGYTRQRADQVSFKVGANDLYRSYYDNHIGSGALVKNISQIRDPYLDIRYRNASTDTYHYDTWLAGLQNIASILDEVGKGDNQDGLIYKAIQDLAEKLRAYSANPTELNDRLVRNSATSLTLLFHNAANQLQKLYDETVNEFNENISAVNEILTNIRDLNQSIREAEIHGDSALEMRDERNRQIDKLSQYLDIKVQYSFEDIGAGLQVEKLTIKLNNANPDINITTDESVLVDGLYATQLSVAEEKPVLNTFGDQYSYLKGYTYLKKIAAGDLDALKEYFDENGLKLENFLKTTDDGAYYLFGTHDPNAASKTKEPIPASDYDAEYLETYDYIIKIPVSVDGADGDEELKKQLDDFLAAHPGLQRENLLTSEDGDYYIIGTDDEDAASKQPVLNEYDDGYLEGYEYLIRIPADDPEALQKYLADNPEALSDVLMSQNFLTIKEPEDGSEPSEIYFLFGTNDPDLDNLYTEPNDNFSIQLGKLLNVKGGEWKDTSTSWAAVTDLESKLYNVWSYAVSNTLEPGNTFIIDGYSIDGTNNVTFEIVADEEYDESKNTDTLVYIKASDIAGNKFAEFVADKYKQLDKYKDYDITAEKGNIIFKAKKPVDSDDPNADTGEPDIKVTPAGTDLIKVGDPVESQAAEIVPKGVDLDTYPQYEYDEHGRVTKSVNYIQDENGRWYRLTFETKYTHEVTLDDNDLRGILQAQRELLTEEGEFSSEKDVLIDESALTKRGIPYYIKSLDLLAQKFAEAYNELNKGYIYNQNGNYIKESGEEISVSEYEYDEDGNLVTDENGDPVSVLKPVSTGGLTPGQLQYLIDHEDFSDYILKDENGDLLDANGKYITDGDGNRVNITDIYPVPDPDDPDVPDPDPGTDQKPVISQEILGKIAVDMNAWLEDNGGGFRGGNLFTTIDGKTEGIKAGNISVSNGWSNGEYGLIPTFMMLFTDSGGLAHSTQNDNADHMVAMIDKALTYNPRDLDGSDAIGPNLFSGSFNDMLSNMMSVEGEDASITSIRLTTSAGILNEVDFSREGVSGVDLNDEAMNMITYSKAMSAAMRVMTVIDEMLDRLINNTAI